jgi:hypothetical protein
MKRGLLFQGITECGLTDIARQLDADASESAQESLLARFGENAKTASSRWSAFGPPARTWTGVDKSLLQAIADVRYPAKENVLLLEEPWRDPIVLETIWGRVPEIITDAWYPSDDLYVCDRVFNWCLTFTGYDTIALYYSRMTT